MINSNGHGGHELVTVRAGQPVVFECAATAQPQPRVRWYKLQPMAPGQGPSRYRPGGSSVVQASSAATNLLAGSGASQRLDEQQIRAHLQQWDLAQHYVDSLKRFEITSKGEF